MPTHKAAEKKMRSDKKRHSINVSVKSTLKTLRTNVLKAKTKEAALKDLNLTISNYGKAAAKGTIHKNTAARKISRLTKKVNAMK